MSGYVVDPPAIPSVAVRGAGARFPVRRIFCVGRNYADHVAEMGGDVKADPPVFFTKPADAVVESGAAVPFPPDTDDLHFEAELVIALKHGGADIPPEHALDRIYGYAVGIDLTRRDRQAEAKAKGRPWDVAKAFDNSAPISEIAPVDDVGHPGAGRIWLTCNERLEQDSDISRMIWPPASIIAALSQSFKLAPGDLIYTGTPDGVGPVRRGQTLDAGVEGVAEMTVTLL